MNCDAKVKPFPAPSAEVTCERVDDDHAVHTAILRNQAFPGSETQVTWQETDRRNYHGTWPGYCNVSSTCTLPNGHRGDHAR